MINKPSCDDTTVHVVSWCLTNLFLLILRYYTWLYLSSKKMEHWTFILSFIHTDNHLQAEAVQHNHLNECPPVSYLCRRLGFERHWAFEFWDCSRRRDLLTKFGIVNYHWRCVGIEVENCKRVLERHDFISSSDTDQEAKVKLAKMFGCSSEDMCNTCGFKKGFASSHKAVFYLKWLDCPERTKKEYYEKDDVSQGHQN